MPEATALDWPVARLRAQLGALLPGLAVETLAHTDSTNTRLLERVRQGSVQPCLLVAEAQSAGRGRNGHTWLSAIGASLTFSLGVPLARSDWSGLSLAVGVALADAIEPLPPARPPRLQLKWPNDLWLRDGPAAWRKLGGILIETVSGHATRMAVIGVGINVLPRADATGLASGYACVQELRADADAPSTLAALAEPLLRAVQTFDRAGLVPFLDGYARRDLLRGRAVQCSHARVTAGTAEGIDASGALLVRADGVLHAVVSGEVAVRPALAGQEAA